MSVLKSYIRNFLNERVNVEMSASFERKEPLSAYFDIIPRVSDGVKNKIYKELKEKEKIVKGFWEGGDSSSNWMEFDKTESNLKAFIKIVEENKPEKIKLEVNKDFIMSTLKDDLPLILGQAGGDYNEWVGGKKMVINRDDSNDIGWAIHDVYHPNEGSSPNIFPSPRMDLSDGTFEGKIVNSLGSEKREKMLNNIIKFFENIGFTKGVGPDDVYASIWAYIVMNVDIIKEIDELEGLSKNSKKYFKYTFMLVKKWEEEWLNTKKGKVFVNYSV